MKDSKIDAELSAESLDTSVESQINTESEVEETEAEETAGEDDGEISFADLGLNETVLAAIEKKGFKTPSPIQVLAIPRLLNGDTNLIAKARTGTGKTAAFGLPIVQNIQDESDHVRALILEPTRELAIQTCTEMQSFATGKFPRVTVLYGGASYSTQIKDLRRGTEIVVGTPGRIKDHLERGTLKLDKIDYFILDEGDEMLDMGFVDDIKSIFAQANPDSRILLFSATMPKPILQIAEEFMGEYDIVQEEGFVEEPLLIDQKYWVVSERDKIEALVRLIDISPDFYGLVFTMTKSDADLVSRLLDERGYEAAALHGDIPQGQREKILARFRSRKTRVLVATDVAARGIDITGLSHVVNYSLPFDAATYVHRIGRTGRAGTSGTAVTFVRPEERRKLEFLRNRIRAAAKGEMKEEQVPSVEKVLDVKRVRMLDELKVKLGLKEPVRYIAEASKAKKADDDDEVIPMPEEETAAEGESAPVSENSEEAAPAENAFIPSLKAASELYVKMASELCEGQEAQAVLAAILEVNYGKSLDESHYGKVQTQRSGGSSNPNQKRIYVQLGRRDGFNAKAIADYFSDLLHIPGRMVDRIDVAQNFTLLSLPTSNALRALELSKSRNDIPHMHLDSKETDNFGPRGGRSRRGGRDNADRSDRGFGGRGRRDRGERFGGDRGFGSDRGERSGDRDRYAVARGDRGDRGFGGRGRRGNDGFKNEHGRTRVHTSTSRNGASAYKKSNKKAEEY